ncbi:MAG: alpha/beta hydrolase fold domain-containing protein, partial [Bradyrhizobium sp.]|nr:alpha/beta hydrolase fold domain-containing protein [Bradyrhizobium sp.]
LSDEAKAPAQFLDAARAIQFVRSRAKPWNLDPGRIAATGASAGAESAAVDRNQDRRGFIRFCQPNIHDIAFIGSVLDIRVGRRLGEGLRGILLARLLSSAWLLCQGETCGQRDHRKCKCGSHQRFSSESVLLVQAKWERPLTAWDVSVRRNHPPSHPVAPAIP